MRFQKMQPHEYWEGFVGGQSPEDFMRYSREAGAATAEVAVKRYVKDLPDIFGEEYSAKELEAIERGLVAYLKRNGYN